MEKYRKAHLLLHRKLPLSRYCICGSIMVPEKDWTCRRMIRLGEPKAIEVYIQKKAVAVRG